MNSQAQHFNDLCDRLQKLRSRYDQLEGVRRRCFEEVTNSQDKLIEAEKKINVGRQVGLALDKLAEDAYDALLQKTTRLLSSALRDVLGQELQVTCEVKYSYEATNVTFGIKRDEREEDLLYGQGGSVANVVSTGLRLLALACLPADRHRRFLVLDEQDCWLQPAIVPRFVQIVHSAAKQLGFQVLMISHHDPECFARYADRMHELIPMPDGVHLRTVLERCSHQHSS